MNGYYQNKNIELSSILPKKKKSRYNADGLTARPIGSGRRGKNGSSLPDGMSLATGCKVYADCLTCPLPKCIYDEALTTQIFKAKLGKIFDLQSQGFSIGAVARRTGYSRYSIRDILQKQRGQIDKEYTENEFLLGLKPE